MAPHYLARAGPEYLILGPSLEVWVLRGNWSNLEGWQSNPSESFPSLSQGTIGDIVFIFATASSLVLREEGTASITQDPGRLPCSRLVEHRGMCPIRLRAALQTSPVLLLHRNEGLGSVQPRNEAGWARARLVGGPLC